MKTRLLLSLLGTALFGSTGYTAELSPIPFRITSQKFEPDDSITIHEVIASSPQLKVGDTVIVRGTYRLQSQGRALLGFFLTTKGPSGSTQVDPRQRQKIERRRRQFRTYPRGS